MAKISYTATDANGTVHTRKSDRGYSHTVVARYDRDAKMAVAVSNGWAKTERSNFAYYLECAAGTHTHVTRVTPAGGYHASYTAEQVEGFQAAQREENAKRIAHAKSVTEGVTVEEYVARNQADRVAAVEALDFNAFHNLGWCGRYDLAQKLHAKSAGGTWCDITILAAVAG